MAEREKSEAATGRAGADQRALRLAEALKANLRRRKAQARARKDDRQPTGEAQGDDAEQG